MRIVMLIKIEANLWREIVWCITFLTTILLYRFFFQVHASMGYTYMGMYYFLVTFNSLNVNHAIDKHQGIAELGY